MSSVKPKNPLIIDPTKDGIDFINIGTLAKTELGTLLAHYQSTYFFHPRFGPFNCLEGIWHYLKTENKFVSTAGVQERDIQEGRETLRRLIGHEAKLFGRKLQRKHCVKFHEKITIANYHRINQNPQLKELFIESDLPFEQFYIFGPEKLVIRPKEYYWLLKSFEEIRTHMKNGTMFPENYDTDPEA